MDGLRRLRLGAGLLALLSVGWHALEAWRSTAAGSLGALGWSGVRGGPLVLLVESIGAVLPLALYLGAVWLERRRAGSRGVDAVAVSALLLAGALLWHLATAWGPKWTGADPWSRWASLLDLAAHPLGYALGLLLVGALVWHVQLALGRALPSRGGSFAALLLALALGWPLLAAWVALGTGAPPGAVVQLGGDAPREAPVRAAGGSSAREGSP